MRSAMVFVLALMLAGCSGTKEAAKQPQHISHPELGFSLDIPTSWVVEADNTPGSIFFARSAPAKNSARIFRGETTQPLEQNVLNVLDMLNRQGATEFVQQPAQVGDLPGIRLDYVANDGPSGARSNHSSYRVKKGDAVFSLVVATTDPAKANQVLADIASSFRLL